MCPEPLEWKEITPEELIPAIEHIRESFEESEWKCRTVTEKLCYSALHPQAFRAILISSDGKTKLTPWTNL